MALPPTRIEEAAREVAELLRWGLEPLNAAPHQSDEWPYRLIASGGPETKKLCAVLQELEDALKERNLLQ